jgi:hypothetical protein
MSFKNRFSMSAYRRLPDVPISASIARHLAKADQLKHAAIVRDVVEAPTIGEAMVAAAEHLKIPLKDLAAQVERLRLTYAAKAWQGRLESQQEMAERKKLYARPKAYRNSPERFGPPRSRMFSADTE